MRGATAPAGWEAAVPAGMSRTCQTLPVMFVEKPERCLRTRCRAGADTVLITYLDGPWTSERQRLEFVEKWYCRAMWQIDIVWSSRRGHEIEKRASGSPEESSSRSDGSFGRCFVRRSVRGAGVGARRPPGTRGRLSTRTSRRPWRAHPLCTPPFGLPDRGWQIGSHPCTPTPDR
jgi:hypothetical protein